MTTVSPRVQFFVPGSPAPQGSKAFKGFAGIGSEVYQAVKLGRRAIGIELKPSYWRTAVENMTELEAEMDAPTLFDEVAG